MDQQVKEEGGDEDEDEELYLGPCQHVTPSTAGITTRPPWMEDIEQITYLKAGITGFA